MSTDSSYGTGRDRLLAAAREIFADRGFRGATTRDIAAKAGLTEPMVFRHFGSKTALFEEAAVAPVVAFMDEYVDEWGRRDHLDRAPIEEAKDFFERLVQVMTTHRSLLMAVLTAGQFDEELAGASERLQGAVQRVADMFDRMMRFEFQERGMASPDEPALARVMLGVVVSIALHHEWFALDEDVTASQDRMITEAARVFVEGIRPPVS